MTVADSRAPTIAMVATGILCTIALVVFARLAYGLLPPGMREGLGLNYARGDNPRDGSALGYLALVITYP